MFPERAFQNRPSRVIVVANEKGGSGKSTIAMHVAVALMKSGRRVASVDLDTRQMSFTRYVENRRAWSKHIDRPLEIPDHYCLDELPRHADASDEMTAANDLVDLINDLAKDHDIIIIDTPGHQDHLTQLVHLMADTLITPMNDSFLDFDVLGTVDPDTLEVVDTSYYARMVDDARRQREAFGQRPLNWIVVRNRLSMLGSRNKRLVGDALRELSQRLNFRFLDGLAERLIFREYYPRGLTSLDNVNEATLGLKPTMSHVTARQEVQALCLAMESSLSSALNASRSAA